MQAPIIAFIVLGVILWLTLGSFQPLLVLLLTGTLFGLAMGLRRGRGASFGSGIDPDRIWSAAALSGLLLLALQPNLIYAEVVLPYNALRGSLAGIFVLAGLGVTRALSAGAGAPDRGVALLIFSVVALLGVRILVPFASPAPVIDVFVNNSLGVDYLLDGHNPYRMTYPDVYHGAYAFVPALGYPPGALLLLVPFKVLGDVRLASVFADALSVVLLLVAARRAGWARRTRWLACLAWLGFPASLFVLEQAWLDPLLVPLMLSLVLFVGDRRWIGAGVMLGLMIAVKQYTILLSLGTAVFAWRAGGRAALVRGTAAAALVLLVLIVPFAWGDPGAFYDQVAGTFLARGFRRDSLSLAALIANVIGQDLPGAFLAGITALGVLGWALWLALRTDVTDDDWFSAILFSFAIALLFGKQAACNYYYLLAAMLLARSWLAPSPSSHPDRTPRIRSS